MIAHRRAGALPLLLAASLLSTPAPAAVAAVTPVNPRIPEVHTTSLTGQSVDLPAQLAHAQAAVLILGFSKDARTEARDWGRRLAADYSTSPTVLYYEMPVLASVPRLLRSWVLHQIASEVSEGGKPHFAPITDSEARWRQLARVNRTGDAYILLLDHNGDVLSTRSGPLSDPAYSALRHEIQALPPSTEPRSSTP